MWEQVFKFVSTHEAYPDDFEYHVNYFVTEGGFAFALGMAILVALAAAILFYFGLCMKRQTIHLASLPVWGVMLILVAAVSFLIADKVFIGQPLDDEKNITEESLVYRYSFCKANDIYYGEIQEGADSTNQQSMMETKDQIEEQLAEGTDVALAYSLTTAFWAIFFFWLFSCFLKGFSVNGIAIPHLWPHNRK